MRLDDNLEEKEIGFQKEFEIYSNGFIKLQSISEEYHCPGCNSIVARRFKRSVIVPKPKTIMIRNDGVIIICKSCNKPLSLKKIYDFGEWDGVVNHEDLTK